MAKTSEKYEVMYVLNPNLSEEETAALVEKFKALVEQNGTLDEMEEMGSTISPRVTTCLSSSRAALSSRRSSTVSSALRTASSAA